LTVGDNVGVVGECPIDWVEEKEEENVCSTDMSEDARVRREVEGDDDFIRFIW
jgi:hypothetical protein